MNTHQIITGALNHGESVFAIGSVEGINFTACAVGCDIVVLANDFQRVQIIPGCSTGYIHIGCVDCCLETGKIAAAFGDCVKIFEPMALAHHTSEHKLDYKWFETSSISVGSKVNNLSWNLEGLRLLVSTGMSLKLYQYHFSQNEPDRSTSVKNGFDATSAKVHFSVEDDVFVPNHSPKFSWENIWKHELRSPVNHVKFSPDGTLFATCGAGDSLVKVWYQDFGGGLNAESDVSFSFAYLPHPNAVVGFEWRKTGRYTPRGSIMNVLMTWCRDFVSRIWCETSLPSETCGEMLLALQIDNLPVRMSEKEFVPRKQSTQKTAGQRLASRLKHLRKLKSKEKKTVEPTVETIPTPYSVNTLYQVSSAANLSEPVEVPTVVHFHLAASIHPDNDCFLVPSIENAADDSATFSIHWLNNKELHYSLCVEKLLAEALSAVELSATTNLANFNVDQPSAPVRRSESNKCSLSNVISEDLGNGGTEKHASSPPETSTLDYKLEHLLREWQQSSDILFTIHPLDGSLLVWTVDYIDNHNRQPAVVFSSRLPGVFPLSDAASLNHNVATFNPHDPIYVELLHRNVDQFCHDSYCSRNMEFPCYLCNTIFLLTNHQNGTLNLWHLNVDEKSDFRQILSVTHKSRMCGHRFRISTILCHPVLPLFLTSSHHNVHSGLRRKSSVSGLAAEALNADQTRPLLRDDRFFNSELILWKVNPVGPLCKSGGVRELARINSPKFTAFSSLAWIPAILPSSTLGVVSNSPSSCFVAFDGRCLRVYQAVIDARALLAEVNYAKSRKPREVISSVSSETDSSSMDEKNMFNIVSSQSTARPGCIIELDAIENSLHDWKNVHLLHVYHEQMLFGDVTPHEASASTTTAAIAAPSVPSRSVSVAASSMFSAGSGAVLDRSKAKTFNDRFYLVALEKRKIAVDCYDTIVHVWLLAMSSQAPEIETKRRVSVHRFDLPSGDLASRDEYNVSGAAQLFIHSKKVCTQALKLHKDVKVLQACPTAGHLPSSSLYPACRAPYLLITACSDDKIRYWYCQVNKRPSEISSDDEFTYSWSEWSLDCEAGDKSLEMDGRILSISSAYSGRLACSFDPTNTFDPCKPQKVISVQVGIYECESTGGTEWLLEDRLHLNNIVIPRIAPRADDFEFHKESPVDELLHGVAQSSLISRIPSISNLSPGMRSMVPEFSFKSASEMGPPQVVRLDWVSAEDGSYILTVSVGPKIFLFAPVTEDLAQQNVAMMHESDSTHPHKRSMLRKASTIAAPPARKLIRWMNVRTIELESADGLPPLPLMFSWIREGILVVGMETEMRVYNQWNILSSQAGDDIIGDSLKVAQKHDVASTEKATGRQNRPLSSLSVPASKTSLGKSQSALDLKKLKDHPAKRFQQQLAGMKRTPRLVSTSSIPGASSSQTDLLSLIRDEGLFEAARLATPLLPQYHPRLLMELLYAGKTRRVKAILLHVLRVIRDKIDINEAMAIGYGRKSTVAASLGVSFVSSDDEAASGRSRSVAYRGRSTVTSLSEDAIKNYVDVDSIPPLPLYALFAAEGVVQTTSSDSRNAVNLARKSSRQQQYDDLFNVAPDEDDLNIDIEDDFDDDEADDHAGSRPRVASVSSADSGSVGKSNAFSAKHTRLLSRLLTHVHLPGLSSVDQMHLLAVSDTLSSFSSDVMDKLSHLNAGHTRLKVGDSSSSHASVTNGAAGIDTIDECGLRFLMALKQYEYLLRCLPLKQRALLRSKGLATSYTIWALHSDSENELVNSLSCMQKNEPKWEELRTVGAGWWLKNLTVLRICIEKIAKAAFHVKCDPMDAAIYYMAMHKKNLITHLYKSAKNAKMMDFFANDFSQDKWKKAALKNAFVLMGKQRFEHAVAFFLLGGAFQDALQVCVHNLNDLQLALVIVRLHETNPEKQQQRIKKLLCEHVLGVQGAQSVGSTTRSSLSDSSTKLNNAQSILGDKKLNSGVKCADVDYNLDAIDPDLASQDPFLRSMAFWVLKEYRRALSTLLENQSLLDTSPPYSTSTTNLSEVFSFYVYLRMHPLVVRQRLDDMGVQISSTERFLQVAKNMESQITPSERKLYFKTASIHFKSGCPLLALEVLCKLPKKMWPLTNEQYLLSRGKMSHSPILRKISNSQKLTPARKSSIVRVQNAPDKKEKTDLFEWNFEANVAENRLLNDNEELKLDWSDEKKYDSSDEEEDTKQTCLNGPLRKISVSQMQRLKMDQMIVQSSLDEQEPVDLKLDIMAQQLKFIACLKIIMEELSTLASTTEVDGGQLRVQLYNWLEKEVEVLRQLCDYNVDFDDQLAETWSYIGSADGPVLDPPSPALTDDERSKSPVVLHEALKVDRVNMTQKMQQSIRRRLWLSANQQLLRTLSSYCSLHSSQGVGLASVRMELLLLLQELQQEPSKRSLLAAPIAVQTSFPLLAASVASIKTDIAGPLRYLHCQISDLLKSFCDLKHPPQFEEYSQRVSMFYTLSHGLSSCIYESLCDVDNLSLPKGFTGGHGYLLRRRRRKSSCSSEDLVVSSAPHKWPGAENLLAYLSRERDEDVPNLLLLLAETWTAVYLALFVHAFCTYDSRWLFRLCAHSIDAQMFSAVFGGGAEVKSALTLSAADTATLRSDSPSAFDSSPSLSRAPASVDPSNLRARFNAKIFGPDLNKNSVSMASTAPNRKNSSIITTKNRWIQPRMSIITYFTAKPIVQEMIEEEAYDSDATVSDVSDEESEQSILSEDFEGADKKAKEESMDTTAHSDPNSFAWLLLRLAVLRQVEFRLKQFLIVCGIELNELGAVSPLIHACMRILKDWKRQLNNQLEEYPGGCPSNFLPRMTVERTLGAQEPPLNKYKLMEDPKNTPFSSTNKRADPVKRLWLYLVRQEHLAGTFIRFIFKSRYTAFRQDSVIDGTSTSSVASPGEELKICQRELDPITAFAVSQARFGWIVLATPRELQEMDIASCLTLSRDWLLDPTEVDLATYEMTKDPLRDNDDYVLINPREKQTRDAVPGRHTSFLCKRPMSGVRRLESHPSLPYYLSGSNDGSVRLWEWGVSHALFTPRVSGHFAKVTRTRFNAQGNKFGITDGDGALCLWQVSHGLNMKKPFLTLKCHSKTSSDFSFLGNSSSLLATAGYSTGDANVSLWDTLLPQHKSLIHSWSCHPEGSTTLLYVPQRQILLSGGRHGEVCVFDVRERKLRATIKAFDHATIKALTLQPAQERFLVGSSDGDIKVFNLATSTPQLVSSMAGEHAAKGGFSLRQVSSGQVQGVQQLYVDNDQRLFSCGADCSIKIRTLKTLTPDSLYTTI